MNDNPIGVFDSGIGGISVVKQIMQLLPNENILYFGDIARLPYGNKSDSTIRQFACQTAKFLLKQQVKALVIACNTIAAVAKNAIAELAGSIPIIDVLNSGSNASIKQNSTNSKPKIGVIATNATINSHAYRNVIAKLSPGTEIVEQACPLLVPFIEEGYLSHQALTLILQEYLAPLNAANIDTLILGCTHYPLITAGIQPLVKRSVIIIDPAVSTAQTVLSILNQLQLLNHQAPQLSTTKFYVTEQSPNFINIAEMFLQCKLNTPILVDLNDL